ncbi:MAG: cytochrome P460 family protein [Desulfuromonadales bacterium]|nr:cytochrome P460 family protein [Desulfuromonadales bacterium]
MKKLVISGFLIATMMLSVGAISMAETMPGADGDILWNYITEKSPYTKWSYWPDHQGMQDGRAPHGPQHKVFVNKLALESAAPPLQYGAIQVKENYSKANELKAITVMYKIKGYNPDSGDWFWAKYDASGKALITGKPMGCIGCHGTRAANDFVLVHEFK